MSTNRIACAVVSTLSFLAVPIAVRAAAVTTAITYQGQLKENGLPANGSYDFRFTLFSPGLPIQTSVCAFNVPVVNGTFASKVDFGAPIYSGVALSLDVDVRVNNPNVALSCFDDNFVQLSPVQEITPVPYAHFALDAPAGNALDASDGSPTNAVFVDATGSVGIGTATPATELDVHSSATSAAGQIRSSNSNGDTWLMLWSGFTNGSNDPAIIWSDDVAGDDLRFMNTSVGGAGGGERMRITGAGNVGIGTSSPAQKLHVSNGGSGAASISSSDVVIEDDASAFIHMLTLDANESGILFGHPAASIGGGIVFSAASDMLQFRSGGNTNRMLLDGVGNLGIGTVPATELHVMDPNGTARIRVESGTGQAGISFLSDSTVENVIYSPDGTDDLRFFINSADRMTITSAGNVGIGTNSPSEKLSISGNLRVSGGTAGDSGVQFPANVISAAETLEEAGLASDRAGFVTLEGDNFTATLATRTITVPTDGFVLALASVELSCQALLLPDTLDTFLTIKKTTAPAAETISYARFVETGRAEAMTFHGLFTVNPGANAFSLLIEKDGLDCNAFAHLTLLFVPTAYGTADTEPAPQQMVISGGDEETLAANETQNFALKLPQADDGRISELERRNLELEARLKRLEAILGSDLSLPAIEP